MRGKLGLRPEDPIGLYCGSLYPGKRVPFLLDAAEQIATMLHGFRLLVIGAGSEATLMRRYAEQRDFIRYLGPLFGREKAVCFRLAQIFLNPGLVGLGILDSFAADLPMVTTSDALHSPEIEYLVHDENGLMIEGGAEAFAREVVDLLRDPARLDRLKRGASKTAERYTIENMVGNCERGIIACLGHEIDRTSTAVRR